jgi:dUTP pyrophosphatase
MTTFFTLGFLHSFWVIVPDDGQPAGAMRFFYKLNSAANDRYSVELNAPGTIDSGYRGEVGVILFNSTDVDFKIEAGDRIAQLVVQKVETVEFNTVDALTESDRGKSGFGSTGV